MTEVERIVSPFPTEGAYEAFSAGVVRVTRRLEICQKNGTTLWNPLGQNESFFKRVVSGGVTVDYNSAERRKVDLLLDNSDGYLSPDPYDGLWYDKVLKCFRGVRYEEADGTPKIWECQLGEFMIDGIASDDFPYQVKITGRDYTKKMLNSKLTENVTFAAGTSLRELIRSLAANSGIPANKIIVNDMGEMLSSEMSFSVGTDRWSIAKEACDSYGYEIFFDGWGVLNVRKFLDPTTSASNWTFYTGPTGNLIEYSKSINDSRIYNRVVVIGNPADGEAERLPYYGMAVNTEPDSPTSIERLGDRVMPPFETNWLSSDEEAQALAVSMLKTAALESYDMDFSSLYYPWLDAGMIITLDYPTRKEFEPDRFLMDTISYPLDLSPMSATAKRVTYVGDPGNIPTDPNAGNTGS